MVLKIPGGAFTPENQVFLFFPFCFITHLLAFSRVFSVGFWLLGQKLLTTGERVCGLKDLRKAVTIPEYSGYDSADGDIGIK
jgi:hypothetical protein